VLDIDRSGDFFVDDWIMEIPAYSAFGGILLNGNTSPGFSERHYDRVHFNHL
jgi:hypothetical protein